MINRKPTDELYARLNWADFEWEHAMDAAGSAYDGEDFVIFHGGSVLMFEPGEITYIRVVQEGCEVGYWDRDEWQDDPQEVFGAIIGCVADQATSAGPGMLALALGEGRQLEVPTTPGPCSFLRLTAGGAAIAAIELNPEASDPKKLRAFFDHFSMKGNP
jgi:hypothetical protein